MYTCPKDPKGPYSLWEVVNLIQNDKDFAEFFAAKVVAANGGDLNAAACVESYLEPTNEDLQGLGIHESQWGSMRKCTDVALLILVIAKQNAPDPFPKLKPPKK